MNLRIPLSLALAVGCSTSPDTPPVKSPPPPVSEEKRQAKTNPPAPTPAATKSAADKECLPVVAAKCGCVYSCGVGVRQAGGAYSVRHDFWKNTTLKARIADWCVSGECTPAFHAEIVCGGICPRRPADSTCHFEGDRCVGTARKSP